MTTYYAIVEGDPLTSGGNSQVIEGNRNCTIDDQEGRSRAQTYLGHKAWCAACQSIGVIAAGAGISDHLRGIDYTIGGAQEAVDGDIVICKCAIHPRLIAVYARCCEYFDTGPEVLATSAAREAVSSTQTYDEQFTLRDAERSPLVDTYYTVRMPLGELRHGVTDSWGYTERYETNGAQSIKIYLGHKQES
ncbi:hypothetical protein LMG27952_07114 [Paraburkholderia hiiakae]|uniref:PAAR domain-containing protein n=1 Tax=Paraburkholderia hiiakae TaxID=1081782 RepID=A0ABM8PA37_9BURK|nr:PAAR domain-containing protein [Paraburkholderia hiiakae]CAD6560409.1 hypothetical protein LMG27952_07114 [Paraburkholderia hiiakae]